MYYQRLLLLFPHEGPGWAMGWYVALMLLGLLMLTLGSRLGQGTITLAFVTVGAVAGKMLPSWFGLKLDPMATTVGLAFVGGIFGYITYRWVAGLGFSLLAVLWTVLGFWMTASAPTNWNWPEFAGGTRAMLPYLKLLKTQLGDDLASQIAPFGVVSFLAALALYTLLPRLATALFWTMAGMTLLVLTSLAYGQFLAPAFLSRLPTTFQGQTLALGLTFLFGLVCQCLPQRSAKQAAPPAAPQLEPALG